MPRMAGEGLQFSEFGSRCISANSQTEKESIVSCHLGYNSEESIFFIGPEASNQKDDCMV